MVEDLVSIVMPVYNKQPFLAEAVQSVIGQDYQKWELIIVDDASRDDSLRIASEFASKDNRVRIVPLPANQGVSHARNVGIQHATGRYLAFLDGDDLWMPRKLSIQAKFMRETRAVFSFSQFRRMLPGGSLSYPVPIPRQVTYEGLLRGNVIGCLTVMLDRARIGEISMPPVRHEDYATWLSILKRGHVALGINEDLARYRMSPTSVSGDKARSAAWTWQVYRQVENLSLWKAAWCFACYVGRAAMMKASDFDTIGR